MMHRRSRHVSLIIFITGLFFGFSTGKAAAQPQTRPLVQPSDITYVGNFKVPVGDSVGCDGNTGNHCFTYGGNALGYNPAHNSLYFGGHDWVQKLAEIGIPSNFSTTAPVLQDLGDVTDGLLGQIGGNNNKLAGTMVYNNRLIVTGAVYYGALIQFKSHGVSGLNLSTAGDFSGFSSMSAAEPRGVSGWMTTIPAEWQSLLGGPALTGNCCYPGNQDTSNGPAAIVFNPDDVGVKSPIPGTTVLYYPFAHPIANYASGNLYYNLATVIRGIAFPSGSRSVLFFGRQGTGPYCYGPGTNNPALGGTPSGDGVDPWCYDPTDSSKGTHAYPYRHQVWAYDANDLLAVKNGSKQSWEIMPYAVWQLTGMDSSGGAKIRGAAFDPASGRLFITQDYGPNPSVDVYQITVSGAPPPPPGPTVSLSASPTSVSSGSASNLTWSTTNSTSCTASGAWSGAKATSGNQSTGALTANSTFTLTCTGNGGSASQSAAVTITATPSPTVSLGASPSSVSSGGSSTLTWSSTNATTCSASGSWSGAKATSGSQGTGGLTANSSYTLTCTGAGGSASSSATVTVTSGSGTTVNVANLAQLQSAISGLVSNRTILLADGTYVLSDTLYLPQNLTNVTIKGASGNRDAVIIKGNGMAGTIQYGFWADNVTGVTFANMTIRDFAKHGIILNGGVDNPVLQNLHIIDINDQFIKNNPTLDGLNGVDNGLLENSLLEYSTVAPDTYTNGLDVHRGRNWVIRNNTFKNFRAATGLAGPAVLMWNGSSDTVLVRNTFVNNQRDIAFGLDPTLPVGGATDHARGMIANNFIYKGAIAPDVPIAIFDSPGTQVYHNTILVNGAYPNAIEYRFVRTVGVDIRNNLTDAPITARDGATGTVSNNVTNATSAMFVNAAAADLHLKSTATAAIDKGVTITAVPDDYDGDSRPIGAAPDIGADEYRSSTSTAPTAPSNLGLR